MTTTESQPAPPASNGAYERGVNYMLGRAGQPQDLGMAAAAFLDAADANDPRGHYAAGMMFLKGVGLSANPETAAGHLRQAAAAGFEAAKRVLDELIHGRDVSAFPIVAQEQAAKPDGTQKAVTKTNSVTPARVLAIVAAALALLGGGGYWIYARQQAAAEQARLADAQRSQLEEQQRAADAEKQRMAQETLAAQQRASEAQDAANAEKRKAEEQQADLAAQSEALRKREESLQTAAAAPAPAPPPAPVTQQPVGDDWNALLKQSMPHLRTMMDAALINGQETVVRAAAAIRSLPQPAHGDRKLARTRNTEGLAALKADDAARSVASLTSALAADPADEEVATNLGYALVKAGRPAEAQTILQRALHLNPSRSSAWYNMALAQAAQDREQAAYAAFLLTYQFAGNQQKSRDWFESMAQRETNPLLKRLAQRLIASPSVVATTGPNVTAAPAVQSPAAPPPSVQPQAAAAAEQASSGKSPLQQRCEAKSFIGRGLCESRECPKPENRGDPFCADFNKRNRNN